MRLEELTPAWLAGVLGRPVDALDVAQVGTGQIGTCFRLRAAGGSPETVLVKLPPPDPAARDMMAGAYRGEVRFYQLLADTVTVRTPACHLAEVADDSGDFVLVLEDLAPAAQGDQIAGCSVDQARDAVVNLAGLHGPRWSDPSLLDIDTLTLNGPDEIALLLEMYGPTTELFLDGLGDLVAPADAAVLRACVDAIGPWLLGRTERFGLVHGDYRLDNLLFPPDGGPGVVAVDWQTLSLALPARDLAYFLGTSLRVADRRAHERDLVAAYHHALASYGVADYSLDDCWDDYVFALIQGPLVSVFGCAYGTRTERGDRMFAAMVERSCAAIRDLGTLDLPELAAR
ncbi:phosphotransferase family protein [Nocardioides mangrovi]|uniref:Ecdysteroid 22-kinase family protein n=1 Tax=Nocardioides mangrovi TaxID=2874580 RepID=A0ABS7UEG5_9ACTN|nr:ecdysteroid 22-kinase family protein [Nocardioides mangrovi]MBZ5739172.1 ecdysteroid 22-kinase family protein [Nocardioides mangrovi]